MEGEDRRSFTKPGFHLIATISVIAEIVATADENIFGNHSNHKETMSSAILGITTIAEISKLYRAKMSGKYDGETSSCPTDI